MTRARISQLLCDLGDPFVPTVEAALLPVRDVDELLPIRVGDYVDFYSSLSHALNMGRILLPDAEPLSDQTEPSS
jgi:fumarylacetoacetase